jgi:hypothetical protein
VSEPSASWPGLPLFWTGSIEAPDRGGALGPETLVRRLAVVLHALGATVRTAGPAGLGFEGLPRGGAAGSLGYAVARGDMAVEPLRGRGVLTVRYRLGVGRIALLTLAVASVPLLVPALLGVAVGFAVPGRLGALGGFAWLVPLFILGLGALTLSHAVHAFRGIVRRCADFAGPAP